MRKGYEKYMNGLVKGGVVAVIIALLVVGIALW